MLPYCYCYPTRHIVIQDVEGSIRCNRCHYPILPYPSATTQLWIPNTQHSITAQHTNTWPTHQHTNTPISTHQYQHSTPAQYYRYYQRYYHTPWLPPTLPHYTLLHPTSDPLATAPSECGGCGGDPLPLISASQVTPKQCFCVSEGASDSDWYKLNWRHTLTFETHLDFAFCVDSSSSSSSTFSSSSSSSSFSFFFFLFFYIFFYFFYMY